MYGMTISLTNRVMIAIGINNYGAEKYWRHVYNELDISMAPETVSFLQSQDKSRFYRKEYKERTSVKKRRVTNNNNKIKELMEKQRIDEKQGKTYGSGVALDSDSIPEFVKEAEERKKELLGIQCPFYGCFVKNHKTTKAKKCQYYGVKNKEELNIKITAYLQNIYPAQYGECYQYSTRIADPRNCLRGLQKVIYRGVTDSTLPFYESLFEEKVIFPPLDFFFPTFNHF